MSASSTARCVGASGKGRVKRGHFMDILVPLGRNRERWGRIDRAAFESGSRHGSVLPDQQSSYPHLTDFEAELQLRVEGLEQAQNKLRSVCQQNMFICSQGTEDA
jgi:hypothetical protein